MWDIRVPIGLLFLVLGILLAGYGAQADPALFARTFGVNVDLIWGLALTLFGAVMFWNGRQGARRPSSKIDKESGER